MQIISREEASKQKLLRYFSGRMCPAGHIAERLVSNWSCVACCNEKSKGQREKRKEYHKKHAENYRNANRELFAFYSKRWTETHRVETRVSAMKRHCAKLKATPPWLTTKHHQQINEFYEQAFELSQTTGVKYHVDHIVPLQGDNVCGLHVPWNLQVMTATENLRKSNFFSGVK